MNSRAVRTLARPEPLESAGMGGLVPYEEVDVIRAWGPRGPRGKQGPPGQGVEILGTVASWSQLPQTGQMQGDVYFLDDTGHLALWDGTQWHDLGPLQGPQGEPGESIIPDPLIINELRTALLRWGTGSTGATITSGSAAPSGTQPAGSIYVRTGSPTVQGQRLYMSTGTAWVALEPPAPPIPAMPKPWSTHLEATSGTQIGPISVPAGFPYIHMRGRVTGTQDTGLYFRFNNSTAGLYWGMNWYQSGFNPYYQANSIVFGGAPGLVNAAAFDCNIWRIYKGNGERVIINGSGFVWESGTPYAVLFGATSEQTVDVSSVTVGVSPGQIASASVDLWEEPHPT